MILKTVFWQLMDSDTGIRIPHPLLGQKPLLSTETREVFHLVENRFVYLTQ